MFSLWLDGVMPMVMDKETSVQEKCFSLLEEFLLSQITPYSRYIITHMYCTYITVQISNGIMYRGYLCMPLTHIQWSLRNLWNHCLYVVLLIGIPHICTAIYECNKNYVHEWVCVYSYPNEMEQFVWQLFDVIASDEDLQWVLMYTHVTLHIYT